MLKCCAPTEEKGEFQICEECMTTYVKSEDTPTPPTVYPTLPSRDRRQSFRVDLPSPCASAPRIHSRSLSLIAHANLSAAKVTATELNIQCPNPSCATLGLPAVGAAATATTADFLADETVLTILEGETELQERYRTTKAELENARVASARRRAYGPFVGLFEARDDFQMSRWAAKNWQARKCPGCDCWIEKNEGCDHMTCRQVGFGVDSAVAMGGRVGVALLRSPLSALLTLPTFISACRLTPTFPYNPPYQCRYEFHWCCGTHYYADHNPGVKCVATRLMRSPSPYWGPVTPVRVLTKGTVGATAAAVVAIAVVPVGLAAAGFKLRERRRHWVRHRGERRRFTFGRPTPLWQNRLRTTKELTPYQQELLNNWRMSRGM